MTVRLELAHFNTWCVGVVCPLTWASYDDASNIAPPHSCLQHIIILAEGLLMVLCVTLSSVSISENTGHDSLARSSSRHLVLHIHRSN